MKKILWINDVNISNNIVKLYRNNNLHLDVILIKSLTNISKLSLFQYDVIISDFIIKEFNFNGLDIFLQVINSGYNKYFIMKTSGRPPKNYKLIFDERIYFWVDEPSAVLIQRIKNILSFNKLYNVNLIETAELVRKINGFNLNYLNLFDYELNHRFKQFSDKEKIQIIQWCSSRFNIKLEKSIDLKDISTLAETIYFKIKETEKPKIYLYVCKNQIFNQQSDNINKVISILNDLYYEVELLQSENNITDKMEIIIYYCGNNENISKELFLQNSHNIIFWYDEYTELSFTSKEIKKYNIFINKNTLQNRLLLDQTIMNHYFGKRMEIAEIEKGEIVPFFHK